MLRGNAVLLLPRYSGTLLLGCFRKFARWQTNPFEGKGESALKLGSQRTRHRSNPLECMMMKRRHGSEYIPHTVERCGSHPRMWMFPVPVCIYRPVNVSHVERLGCPH